MTEDKPHIIKFTDSVKKKAERIAALLGLNEWWYSFGVGIDLAMDCAEAYVKDNTECVFCTPKIADMIKNNPKFIAALAEEGVVEWLAPLVLTKTVQESIGDEAGQ